jgi:hypothetical protein
LLTTLWWRRSADLGIVTAPFLTGGMFVIGAAVLASPLGRSPAGFLFDRLPIRWWIAGIAATGLLLCALALSRRFVPATFVICIFVLSIVHLSNHYFLPRLDEGISARLASPLLAFWGEQNIRGCVYELPRSWIYGLNFYAHREVPECVLPPTLSYQAIVSEKGLEDLARMQKERPQKVYVLLLEGPGVIVGRNMRVLGIGPPLAVHAAGGGKAE